MPRPTFIAEIGTVAGSVTLTQAEQDELMALVQIAGDLWGNYIDSTATITIRVDLDRDENEGTLATGGPGTTFSVGQENGVTIFEPVTITELATGVDQNGASADINITINTDFYDRFFLGSTAENAAIPFGDFDLLTILIHEIGHGLGIISFDEEQNPNIATTFQRLIEDTGSQLFFTGESATAANDGVELRLIDNSHIFDSSFIMSQALANGVRQFIHPAEVGILADIGIPLLGPTSGNDPLTGYSNINDRINALGGDDTINGLSGDDVLDGAGGNDLLMGGLGVDRVRGGTGNDTVLGGGGNDTVAGAAGNDILVGEMGLDIAFAADGNDIAVGDLLITDVSDLLTSPNPVGDTIFGGAGDDTLISGSWVDADNDRVFDTGEADTGDTSANIIFSGSGNDQVYGASGNEILGGGVGDDSVFAAGGNDTIYGGQDGGDVGLNDVIDGGAGADLLFGGAGADNLMGGSGVDNVFGGGGDDTLDAGSGADSVFGGGGDDIITSGLGADQIFFASGHGDDLITDFATDDILILINTATDFSTLADVQAAASETSVNGVDGLLIDTGGGDSIFLQGATLDSLSLSNLVFEG